MWPALRPQPHLQAPPPLAPAETVLEHGPAPGTEGAAPVDPMLGKKALWATYGSIGLTALLLVISHVFDFQALLGGA